MVVAICGRGGGEVTANFASWLSAALRLLASRLEAAPVFDAAGFIWKKDEDNTVPCSELKSPAVVEATEQPEIFCGCHAKFGILTAWAHFNV